MEFYRLFKLLNEESSEDRKRREAEAERRRIDFDDYSDEINRVRSNNPYGRRSEVGSPEWHAYVDQLRSVRKAPTDIFRDAVDEEIVKIMGLNKTTLVGDGHIALDVPSGVHNFLGEPKNHKEEADFHRVLQIIEDGYDDGSSPEETARMVLDLLGHLGYLKRKI